MDLDPDAQLTALLLPTSIRARSLDVFVGDEDLATTPVTLDLTEVDAEVDERLLAGAFVIRTTNTLDVGIGGALDVLPLDGELITKALTVPKGDGFQRLELTQDEVRAVVGTVILFRARARVLGAQDGILRVLPRSLLEANIDLELSLRVGS